MNTELLYVWIGENESGFIKNQGFHFSPAYRFEMKYLEKEGEYRLDCIRNEDYPNIWKRDNLCGLTAMVGENGIGKTSLMKTLLTSNNDDIKLMVYKFGDEFYVFNHLYHKVRYWTDEICENSSSGVRQYPMYMTNAHGGRFDDLQSFVAVFSPDTDIRYHFGAGSIDSESMQMPERFLDLYGKIGTLISVSLQLSITIITSSKRRTRRMTKHRYRC